MERRAFLAILISVFILLAYQHFILPKVAPPPQKKAVSAPGGAEDKPPAATPSPAPGTDKLPPKIQAVLAAQAGLKEQEVVVQTPLYRAVITNRGGRIKSWRLLRYQDDEGEPIELVSRESQEAGFYPLGVEVSYPGLGRCLMKRCIGY